MEDHKVTVHKIVGLHSGGAGESLLIRQFRYWMDAYAPNRSCPRTPVGSNPATRPICPAARILLAEIRLFTEVLHEHMLRPIELFSDLGRCLSRDEALVLMLVRASQAEDPYTEIAAASELLGTYRVESVVRSSRSLAKAFGERRLRLEPIEAVAPLASTQLGMGLRIVH